MKKLNNIIGYGIILLIMSACNKEQMNTPPALSDVEIQFAAPELSVDIEEGSMKTRGPIDAFPDGSSFGVWGYCFSQVAPDNEILNESSGPLPWEQKKALSRPHLFYNVPVKYSQHSCTYDNIVKWYAEPNYLYTFFAYYPYGEGNGFKLLTGDKSLGSPKLKFSIPFESTDINTDLSDSQVPDAMIADDCFNVTRAGGEVNLAFRHILTGLNFTINNYNEVTPVIIHSLKLSGTFYKSMEITLGEKTEYSDTETFKGTYFLLREEEADTIVKPSTSVSEVGGRTLLLLSNLNGGYLGDVTLTIKYTFGGGEPQEQSFGRPENFLPEPGTIYSAQLNFIGNAFVLEFIIDNDSKWEDGGDSDISFG